MGKGSFANSSPLCIYTDSNAFIQYLPKSACPGYTIIQLIIASDSILSYMRQDI